ncbi:MAG: heme ABC transporter permease [Alphaproteobacteria bacterium]|nr:heme ABC transporter permease [Alphaproteobacteria bacterium]
MWKLISPPAFNRFADKALPLCAGGAVLAFAIGLYYALFNSPPDYQQGETVRIMYIHVPSAMIGMGIYVAMAAVAAIGFVSNPAMADIFCVAAAPVGAVFVALCLVTGSLWGEPTWGTWWVWDARLTSVLILFFLYCGYMALRHSFDDDFRGSRAGAILLLVGAVNIPIIKFSVKWWHTLHQGETFFRPGGPSIADSMLRPLLIMALGFCFYAALLVMLRMKTELLARRIERARDEE